MRSFRSLPATFFLLCIPPAFADTPPLPSQVEAHLRTSLERLETLGAVAGVVTPRVRFSVGVGSTALQDGSRPNERTLFEIGSLSKVFLDLLLEQALQEGKVRLDDPVIKHLPSDMPFPRFRTGQGTARAADQVTLWHLATHTSGFPSMPSAVDLPRDWDPRDPSYVTLDMVRTFFSRFIFPREPGSQYEYSNINIGLLGYLLSIKENRDLETVLRTKVLKPLGMTDTCITLPEKRKKGLSKGYNSASKEAGYVNTPIPFSGGGSLKSNAKDLMRYMERALGLVPSGLQEALSQQTRVIETKDGPERTLGYFHYPQPYGDVYLIRSRTFGFRCCMGIVPSRKIGVVILGNCMRFDTPKVFQAILEAVVAAEAGPSEKLGRGRQFKGGADGAFQPMD